MIQANIEFSAENTTIEFAAREFASHLATIESTAAVIVTKAIASGDNTNRNIGEGGQNRIFFGTPEELANVPDLSMNTVTDEIAYQIVLENNRLEGYVTGNSPRAVLLSAYRLLHDLGWRWPDPYTVHTPSKSQLLRTFPIQKQCTPTYRHRGICIEGAVSEEHVKAMIGWAPKAGFNGYFVQFREGHTFFDRWYSEKNGKHLTRDEARSILDRITPEIEKRGLEYHAVGHGWTCEPFGVPGLGWVQHEEPIADDVSRYFAEINGVRELWGGIALNTNLCFSNDEVQSRMAKAVAEYAEEHKEIDFIHVWIGDGTNNNCECDECQKARPSDFYIQILNRIDAELLRKKIGTKIVFLAYVDLFWPPEKERLKHHDRFVLMFAPITRSYSHSFKTDVQLPELPPFERNQLVFPKSVEGNLAFLDAWQKQFEGDGFDFDYHMMWDHYTDPGYTHIAKVLYEDIVELEHIGLAGYMSCQVQRAFFPTGLCMYVMGETLWDATRSYDSIVEEYFTASFGKHGKDVYRYLSNVTALFSPEHLRGEHEESAELTIARLDDAKLLLESAIAMLAPLTGASGRLLREHNGMLKLLAKGLRFRAQGKYADATNSWHDLVTLIEGFDSDVTDRFDDYMFKRVIGGRIFDIPTNES